MGESEGADLGDGCIEGNLESNEVLHVSSESCRN